METQDYILIGLLIAFSFMIPNSSAQHITDIVNFSKPINLSYNEHKNITNLIFTDTIHKTVIKEFDIKKNNPFYSHLNISDSSATHNSGSGFYVDSLPITLFIDSIERNVYARRVNDNTLVNFAYVKEFIELDNPNYIIISNSMILKKEMWAIGCKNNINILDKHGNLFYTHNSINLNVGYTTITNDGRFFCYTYGVADEGGYLLNPGFRIIDIASDEVIVDSSCGSKYLDNILIWSEHNYILVEIKNTNSNELIFYNLDDGVSYYKKFNSQERKNWISFDKNGITIKDSNGSLRKYLFTENFKLDSSLLKN